MAVRVEVVDVGEVESVPDGGVRIVTVRGREIGLIRWGDRVYALRNLCPHESAPLCSGKLEPFITRSALEDAPSETAPQLVVACPWHRWEFDVESGRALLDSKVRVKTYETRIKDGRVLLQIAAG